jgi:hypothetical protein
MARICRGFFQQAPEELDLHQIAIEYGPGQKSALRFLADALFCARDRTELILLGCHAG